MKHALGLQGLWNAVIDDDDDDDDDDDSSVYRLTTGWTIGVRFPAGDGNFCL
jgi:hypothetical protein